MIVFIAQIPLKVLQKLTCIINVLTIVHRNLPVTFVSRPPVLRSSEDFTVLIRNNIHFPKFNYTRAADCSRSNQASKGGRARNDPTINLTMPISSAARVMYLSYVDEPQVILIKKPLKTSLQHAQGSIVESHPVKFCDTGSCCTSGFNENHDHEEHKLRQPLRQRASSPDCQKWCCCGKCQPTQKYHEQLCCQSEKKKQCITTSHWFQQLLLSSHTLKKALLYKDPFLDLADGSIDSQLRHLAYKQYVHWCCSFDLKDRAPIPSSCRWKIRDTYPKAVNNCAGFKME
ncbi:LOW QUALITY PROTEIN: P2X purinoceptor 7-like [Chlamydotis macqueenii]